MSQLFFKYKAPHSLLCIEGSIGRGLKDKGFDGFERFKGGEGEGGESYEG